jgi:hypothetical protein
LIKGFPWFLIHCDISQRIGRDMFNFAALALRLLVPPAISQKVAD